MQVRPLVEAVPVLGAIWPGYLHLLTVGWITQLIIGTAFILLNAGVLLAGFGQVQGPMTILPLLGRVAEAAAAAAFAAHTWKRIRPYGTGSRVT